MWHLLFFIVPTMATVWAMFKMRGIRTRERKMIIIALLVLCAAHFSIQDYAMHVGHYPFVGAKFIHDFAATLLLPLVHLLFCYSLGITTELRFLRLMLMLCLLMVPELMVVLTTPTEVEYALLTDHFNYVQLMFGPEVVLNVDIYCVVVGLQMVIEGERITVMGRIFKRRDLFLSSSGRWVMRGVCATAMWIIISLLIPRPYVQSHITVMNVLLIGYSFFITLVFVMVTLYFNNEAVVDSTKTPAPIEKDVDAELAEDVRKLIETEKVYLNSNLHIEEFAAMLSSNRTYITRVCKSKFNMTFTELMNHHRVEHAKTLLLAEERKRMEDIAAESGFSSSSFFARVFKQYTGATPSVWRSRELENLQSKALAAEKALHEGMTTEEALMEHVAENSPVDAEVNGTKGEVNKTGGGRPTV